MVPLIPVFGRLRQGDCCEYKANLSYSVSSAIKVIIILIRAGDKAQFVECLPLIPEFDSPAPRKVDVVALESQYLEDGGRRRSFSATYQI